MIFSRLSILLSFGGIVVPTQPVQAASNEIHYRTVDVAGVNIFYREAGNPKSPTILLLHGFPTSSHMFRDLIPLLADRFHLLAPDYPGFGHSARPAVGLPDADAAGRRDYPRYRDQGPLHILCARGWQDRDIA